MRKLTVITAIMVLFSPIVVSEGIESPSEQYSVLGDSPTVEFSVPQEAEIFVFKLESESLPTTEVEKKLDLCSNTEVELEGLKTPLADVEGFDSPNGDGKVSVRDLNISDDSEYDGGIKDESINAREGKMETEYSSYPNCNTDSMNSTNTTFSVGAKYYPDERIIDIDGKDKAEIGLSKFKEASCLEESGSCTLRAGYLDTSGDRYYGYENVELSSNLIPPPTDIQTETLKGGDIRISFSPTSVSTEPARYILEEKYPDEEDTYNTPKFQKIMEIPHENSDAISVTLSPREFEGISQEEIPFRLASESGNGKIGEYSNVFTGYSDRNSPRLDGGKVVETDRIFIELVDSGVGLDKESIEKEDFQVEGSKIESLDFEDGELYANLETNIEASSRPEIYLSSDSDGIKDKVGNTLTESANYNMMDEVPPELESIKAVNPNGDNNYEAILISLSEGVRDGHPSIPAFSLVSEDKEIGIDSTASGGSLTSNYESSYDGVVLELEKPQKLSEGTELEYDDSEDEINDDSYNKLNSFTETVKLAELPEEKSSEEGKEVPEKTEDKNKQKSSNISEKEEEKESETEDARIEEENVTEMEPVDLSNETTTEEDIEKDSESSDSSYIEEEETEESTAIEDTTNDRENEEKSAENKQKSTATNESNDEVEDKETTGTFSVLISFISSLF